MEYDINDGVEDFGLPCPPWDQDYVAAAFDDHHSIINLQRPETFFDGLDDGEDDNICSEELIKQSNKSTRTTKHGRGKELRTAIRVLKPTADQLAAAYQLLRNKKNEDTTTTNTNSGGSNINVDDTTTTAAREEDKPNTILVLERKKEIVAAKNLNNNNKNNNIGPKGDQKAVEVVLPIRDDESSMQLNFESAKRKLHDSYERINNAKKRRSIQVIDFQKPPLPPPKPKARTSKYPHNKFHQPRLHQITSY